MAQYCVYTATSDSSTLNPAIVTNDKVCVDCPSSGKCRGQAGQQRNQLIKDKHGNQERIQLTPVSTSCTDCPAGAKSGYSFGSVGGDIW